MRIHDDEVAGLIDARLWVIRGGRCRRKPSVFPVSEHDVPALDYQFADFTLLGGLPTFVDHGVRYAGKQVANRNADAVLSPLLGKKPLGAGGFRRQIADLDEATRWYRSPNERDIGPQDLLPADADHAKRVEIAWPACVDQCAHQGWYNVCNRHLLRGDLAKNAAQSERLDVDDVQSCPRQQSRQHLPATSDRGGAAQRHEDVCCTYVAGVHILLDALEQVALAVHDPLRSSGAAGGIEHYGRRIDRNLGEC
ncbi:hypothetical protein CDS [Bradyrhizobium sp.]|nr:hypothetical protein CDS [Bradyrhizobium sp.]